MPILFRTKTLFVVALCLMSYFNAIFAQTPDPDTLKVENLDKMYIVGTAKPSSTKQSVPIQTMDKKSFEKLGIQDLYEAVRTFSGVSIRDYGGIGGVKTVSVRNMGSQHTAVCYDGITLSNAQSGQIDIGRFSLDNVEQISLSIGQSDDIFQTARLFASAGALNIRTSKPVFGDRSSHVTASMRFASFGTYNPYLLYQQRLSKRWSFGINGDWLTSDGEYPFTIRNGANYESYTRINSQVNTARGELNIYGDLGKGGNLTLKGNYLYSHRGLPGSVVLYNQDAKEWLWDRNGFGSAHYQNRLSDQWAIMANLKYTYSWNRYLALNDRLASGKEETFYTQNEYYASVAGEFAPVEGLRFTLVEDYFINTLDATLTDFVYPVRQTSLTALAGQYKNSRVTLTASLLGTFITEEVEVGTPADDKMRLSPSVSISYKLFEKANFRIRASYKDAYRAPNFNDLYYSRVGNRNLLPEKATQFNLGLTWSGTLWPEVVEYASFSVDGYSNLIKDKIVAIPTMFIWRMLNIGKVGMSGLDVNGVAQISLPAMMSLSLNANYSLQYAVDISDPESKTYMHQIPYTPRHSGSVTLSWKSRWLNISYLCTAVGKRYSFPQNTQSNLIEGYMDHTVSVNRTFNLGEHKLSVMGEVLNIGNVNYEVVQYYPMPGRSYRLTLKYNF